MSDSDSGIEEDETPINEGRHSVLGHSVLRSQGTRTLLFAGLPKEEEPDEEMLKAKTKAAKDRRASLSLLINSAIKSPEIFGVGSAAALPGGVAGIGNQRGMSSQDLLKALKEAASPNSERKSSLIGSSPLARAQGSFRKVIAARRMSSVSGGGSPSSDIRSPLSRASRKSQDDDDDDDDSDDDDDDDDKKKKKKQFVPPGGITMGEWESDAFKKALVRDAVQLDELTLPEAVEEQVRKIDDLLDARRISREEYDGKLLGYTGEVSRKKALEALQRMKEKRDEIVYRLKMTMHEVLAEESEELPCPAGITEDVFRGAFFGRACQENLLTLKDLCKPEHTRREFERLKLLLSEHRISEEQFQKKCKALTGTVPDFAEQVLEKLFAQNLEMIARLIKQAEEIQKKDEAAKREKEEEKRRRLEMIKNMHNMIETRLEKEEQKSKMLLARRKFQLENMLIETGIALKMQLLEEVDENNTQKAHRLKKSPTWYHVPLVTKTRAARERKNLYLRQKAHNPDLLQFHKPKELSKEDLVALDRSLEMKSAHQHKKDLKHKAAQSLERHKQLMEEKRNAIIEAQRSKQERADRHKQEQETKRKQQIEAAKLQRTPQDVIQQRVTTQFNKKVNDIESKLNAVDSRLAAVKAFKFEQKRHVDSIHQKTHVQEDLIRDFMLRIQSGEMLGPEVARKFGLDFDEKRVKHHVEELTKRMTQLPHKIVIPEIDARGMFEPTREWLDFDMRLERDRLGGDDGGWEGRGGRPTSAPPGATSGRHSPSDRLRPRTAAHHRTDAMWRSEERWEREREGEAGALSSKDQLTLKGLRRDQQRALFHIVREERAREEERQLMIEAVLPNSRKTLEALLDQERRGASERIMRVVAENEMQLLQEMARLAQEQEKTKLV